MWRRGAAGFGDDARDNEDSDQSISEEEEDDLDGQGTRNTVSLGGGENGKGKMQVFAQLEIFRESRELHATEESISSHGKKGDYHINDEVETPIINYENSTSHYHAIAAPATLAHSNDGLYNLPLVASISYSDEEVISDDEKINPSTFRSARENLAITWSEANREVEALVRLNENPCCSSDHHNVFMKEKKSARGGGRRKAKAKFSFPCHSDKKDLSLVVSDSNGGSSFVNIPVVDEIGAVSDDEMVNYIAASQLNVHDKHIAAFEMSHDTRENSMAEILSGFLEMSDLQEGSSELEIRKKGSEQTVFERNVSPSGDSIQEDDDLLDALDSDTSFESEDESKWLCQENAHKVKSIISRTMADQFHEAFRTVSAIDDRTHVAFPRPLCGGIHRKLQQVIQIEKERDILKNASAETGLNDEGMSILVRISSRSLEAKLIACSCICFGDGKAVSFTGIFSKVRALYSYKNLETEMRGITKTMTIIFNPRMSRDVDLEVGSLIRIDPPWKEVQVKDEVIFLCSYFSQVQH